MSYTPIGQAQRKNVYTPIGQTSESSYIPISQTDTSTQTPTQNKLGGGYGASNLTDISGKPLLTYSNPKLQEDQLLAGRTAPTFDITKPQKLTSDAVGNPRMAESISQAIRQQWGAQANQELDHIIPRSLGGSNDKINLRLEKSKNPFITYNPGSNPTPTDPQEYKIWKDVVNGNKTGVSVIDGVRQIAKLKGITLPEDLTPQQNNPSLYPQQQNVFQKIGGAISSGVQKIGGAIESAVKQPISTIAGAGTQIEDFGLGVVKTLAQLNLPSPIRDNVVNYLQTQGDAFKQVVEQNIPQTADSKTAYQVGSFVGSFIPYILTGSIAEKAAAGVATEALGTAGSLSAKTISNIGKITNTAANALGFVGTGQIMHDPKDGNRVDQLKNDLMMFGLFETGVGAIKGVAKITQKTSDLLTKMKSGQQITLQEGETAVKEAKSALKQTTGKSPQRVMADAVKTGKVEVKPPEATTKPTETLMTKPTETPKPETKPAIPPDLQPLAQEARKYKSAEEFIKGLDTPVENGVLKSFDRPQLVYHGTKNKFADENFKVGTTPLQKGKIWFTEHKQIAQHFAGKRGGEVKEVYLKINNPLEYGGGRTLTSEMRKALDNPQKYGYDAIVKYDDGGARTEIAVFNKEQIMTKSQLTDFYNKAVGEGTKIEPTKIIPTEKPTQVPFSQLPVGEGKTKLSSLEKNIKSTLDNAPQTAKTDVASYGEMNNQLQISKAADYVENTPTNEVMKVLEGKKEPPQGLLTNSIYVALTEKLRGGKNVELATKLATLRSTRMGQEIEILKELDKNNPVYYLSQLYKSRIEGVGGLQKVAELRKTAVDGIKSEIKKAVSTISKRPTWEQFINEIQCNY